MSDESQLDEIESYQDHAAELHDIVQSVARLRRWSRFSVQWIVAGCLCVFGAILFAGTRDEVVEHKIAYSSVAVAVQADETAEELRRKNDQLRRENDELRRENDELKRVAGLESRELRVHATVAASAPPSPAPPVPSGATSQTGVIVVRVKHTWAQVAIDGEDTGTTPVRASVAAGVHKVLLVGEGHREQLTVTVPGGGQSVIERNW